MSQRFTLSRRATLGGGAALAAGSAFPAAAQDNKRIVVGTWGGDYSRLLAKNIETPLLVPKGWDVVKDEANAPPRRAEIHRPVHADSIAAACCDRFQPRATTLGKEYAWHALTVALAFQFRNHALHVGQ